MVYALCSTSETGENDFWTRAERGERLSSTNYGGLRHYRSNLGPFSIRTAGDYSPEVQLARIEKTPGKLYPNYLVEARSDSLCGAFFCNVLTR
jgi:hypothetical protein